jgi:hypothetical protein
MEISQEEIKIDSDNKCNHALDLINELAQSNTNVELADDAITINLQQIKSKNMNRSSQELTSNCISSHQTTIKRKINIKMIIAEQIKSDIRNEMVRAFLNICRSENMCIQAFSLIFVIMANAFAAFFIISTILTYFQFEVTTNTRIIFETPAPFPKVTICNNNQFQTEYAIQFLKEINQQVSPNINIFDLNQTLNMTYKEKHILFKKIIKIATARMNDDLNDEEKKKLGHKFDDILVSCHFNFMNCSSADFSWTFDYNNYGNCFVFNSGFNMTGNKIPKKYSYISDISYGLQLELYSGFHENLSLINSNYYQGLGYVVRIENGTYLENNLDGIKASSGFQTDINLYRGFDFYLEKPYSDCVLPNDHRKNFDSDLYELIYHSDYQYQRHLCKIQCIQKISIEMCNCTIPTLLSLFENSSICKTDLELKCTQVTLQNEYFSNISNIHKCLSLCPLECNASFIEYSTSSLKIIADMYVDYVKDRPELKSDFVTKQIEPDVIKSSFTLINIFYDDLSYRLLTELPKMDAVALFAAVGGNMGLFLGVSLFTFGELITLCLDLCFLIRNKKKTSYNLNLKEASF